MNRVLLVDDHATFREALAFMFDREPEFKVTAEAESIAEARRKLEGVDLAIVDLDLPDGNGTALISELRAINPHGIVLVLTGTADRVAHARAVEAGAAGVLHKSARIKEVVDAARQLLARETLLSTEEVIEMLRLSGRQREEEHRKNWGIEQLTPRELDVLRALADGLSDREIAGRLDVRGGTVRNHIVSIFGKLGVHSRLQALVAAVRHGVIEIR